MPIHHTHVWRRLAVCTWLFLPLGGCAPESGAGARRAEPHDTIRVAAPSGVEALDRASIHAALAEVEPGGVVLFAPGLYRIGPLIRVQVAEVTLLGHPDGTTIRGCDPQRFVGDPTVDAFACHGLELAAPRQTVRDLTFEYAWHGLFVGCCFPTDMSEFESGVSEAWDQPGGHRIEGNTFRYSPNGLRVIGEATEPVVVQGNRFIDVYHAIGINGGPVHFLDNEMLVREPERVPVTHYPGDVINVLPFSGRAHDREDHTSCRGNLVQGNRIDGYPDGIAIQVWEPGASCRDNVIRGNTIRLGRVPFRNGEMLRITDPSDSSLVGVPIRLVNSGNPDSSALGGNHIEDNVIVGAQGLGIALVGASGNRVVGNRFTGVAARTPFPGNTTGTDDEPWRHANGSAIWISPGSRANEILDNAMEEVHAFAVVLDGDGNLVRVRSPGDAVLDRGTGNRVDRPR